MQGSNTVNTLLPVCSLNCTTAFVFWLWVFEFGTFTTSVGAAPYLFVYTTCGLSHYLEKTICGQTFLSDFKTIKDRADASEVFVAI